MAEANTDVERTDSEKLGRGCRGLKRKRKHKIEDYVSTSSDSEAIEDSPSFIPPNEVGSLHLKPSSKRRNLTPSFDSGFILGIPAEESSLGDNEKFLQLISAPSSSKQQLDSDYGVNEPSSQGESSHSELLDREPKTKLDSGSTVTIPTEALLSMVRDIRILKSNQKTIMDMLETILTKIDCKADFHSDEDMSKIIDLLPLKSEEDVTQLETLLIQGELFQKLLKYLKGIGGSKIDQAVKLILRRLFTDSLASNYSFTGHKGKKPLQRLKIYEAVLGAVQQNYLLKDVQEVEVENSVKNWLRHAKARSKGSISNP